jgi:AhpD family alkylhydroperoxidase
LADGALGIAIAARCDACIAYYVHDALRAGAMGQEIIETVGIDMLMGGRPATMYGCHAFEALEQFETERVEEAAEKQAGQEDAR